MNTAVALSNSFIDHTITPRTVQAVKLSVTSENPTSYLALVIRFPLRPIRCAEEAEQACEIIDRLMQQEKRSEDESDYCQVLTGLMADWEAEYRPGITQSENSIQPGLSGPELVAYLIQETKVITVKEWAKKNHIHLTYIEDILSHKRKMTLRTAIKLGRIFKIRAGRFLGI